MPSYILQTNNEYHPGNIWWSSAFTPSAWELSYFPKSNTQGERLLKAEKNLSETAIDTRG